MPGSEVHLEPDGYCVVINIGHDKGLAVPGFFAGVKEVLVLKPQAEALGHQPLCSGSEFRRKTGF